MSVRCAPPPNAPCTRTIATGDSLHAVVNSGGVVCLDPGVHRLGGRPLQVTGPPTIWRSSDSSNPAIISGGAQLLDWRPCTDLTCPPGYGGAFTHSMEGIDAGVLPVRQLWVARVRATRRSVAGAALNLSFPHGGFAFSGAAPGWLASAADDQVEVRWPSVIENWIEPRCVVRRVNVSAKAMLLDAGCYANLEARIGKNQRPRPDGAFFENVAGPPAAGEFHRLVRVRLGLGLGLALGFALLTRSAVFHRLVRVRVRVRLGLGLEFALLARARARARRVPRHALGSVLPPPWRHGGAAAGSVGAPPGGAPRGAWAARPHL